MQDNIFSFKWMNTFKDIVMNDKEFAWISKHMNCDFIWKIGENSYLFKIQKGKIISINSPTWNDSWDFSIEGPEEAWLKFVDEFPPPFFNDLLGMVTRLPECELNGNRLLAMQHMRSLSRLFSLTRKV